MQRIIQTLECLFQKFGEYLSSFMFETSFLYKECIFSNVQTLQKMYISGEKFRLAVDGNDNSF